MIRFSLQVIGYTLIASVVWWMTREQSAETCIAAAKGLHTMAGYPAPFLLAEITDRWWLAPPAQLLVGLILASYWLPWRQRFVLLLAGCALYGIAVLMTVVIASSPYIGLPPMRSLVGLLLTKSLLVVVPVLLWFVLAGSALVSRRPGAEVVRKHGDAQQGVDSRPRDRIVWWKHFLAAVALTLILPVLTMLLASSASTEIKSARSRLAAALRSGDDRYSIGAALDLIQLEQSRHGHDLPLIYLTARLCQRHGDLAAAREVIRPVREHPILLPLVRELDAGS